MIYRQGDVLLVPVTSVPEGLKSDRPQKCILAYGEVTGHHHSIDADAADWWKDGEQQYVSVKEPTTLDHQEHGPCELEARPYKVVRQREYTPEAIRNVAD